MAKYMIEIQLESLPMDRVGEMAPREDAMIQEMMDAGTIEKGYVLDDLSGAYIILHAEDEVAARRSLEPLPMFPYMRLRIVPVRNMV